jgi:hypothetical protein
MIHPEATVDECMQEITALEAEIERLQLEFKRFMSVCSEGSARGRAMDLIDKRDWERARAALELKL